MVITKRQEKILNSLIQEYINSAKPVSSELLEEKFDFGVCPATIRNEMQILTDLGYLYQPHTSAGRIPTNNGYRFFVDSLLTKDFEDDLFFNGLNEIKKETENLFRFTDLITKKLALASSGLALTYLFEKDLFWKDGWKEVFQNPEFREIDFIEDFIETVEGFEKNIKSFCGEDFSEPKIYIGREKSVLNSKDFSIVISKSKFPEREEGLLAILGPKRMAYERNIKLINSLIRLLEKI